MPSYGPQRDHFHMIRRVLCLLLLLLPALHAFAAAEPEVMQGGGRFGEVTVYRPAGTPKSVVLFVSGDGGWHLGVIGMAQHLTGQGAIVVGIDIRHYLKALGEAQQACVSLAGDFELLSHDVQKKLGLPQYLAPVLAGYSSGATVVYAVLAQAPPGTFAGAVSLGFCADQDFRGKALCPGTGLHYSVNKRGDFVLEPQPKLQEKWVALQGQQDQVCDAAAVDAFAARIPVAEVQRLPKVGHGFGVERNWLPQFRASFEELQSGSAPPPPPPDAPPSLTGLPLVEVPAVQVAGGTAPADTFAVMISGDGGWAGLDRNIAAAFAARGIPVVGLDSLRYFWSARTPGQAAGDLASIIQNYQQRWHRSGVRLLGYSFGADVLPFLVNRLPRQLAGDLRSITLIAPSEAATFEIHISGWLPGVNSPGPATRPEIARLPLAPLCLHGAGDSERPCDALPAARSVQIGSGHHLGGDAAGIVERILQPRAAPCAAGESCG
ncbi:MAG TPA: AcvB/VirJ family lysyl-phosphatidylglycerol hydrolase [Steroidobacteraceae bacterium]|nr:AcvB/VirJ family lysyl-phosphatidylglycerol hydrolase [Steroidobacteraceae bacterium]